MDLTNVTRMGVLLASTSMMAASCVTVSVLMTAMCIPLNNSALKQVLYNVYISKMDYNVNTYTINNLQKQLIVLI